MDIDSLHARREARRRAVRRRRRLAAGLLAATVALVAVIVLLAVRPRSTSTPDSQRARAAHSSAAARAAGSARPPQTADTASGRPGTLPVPILTYHVIAPPPAGAPFPGLYVTPSEFAAQMQALKSAGWHAVTLDQVQAYWSRGVPLGPGKPVVLTFDNGYQSQYTQALPVLRRLGWAADENIQLSGLPPSQGGLGPGEIRGLLAAGWELDTQGFSHADLITLDAEELHYQVAVARQVLRRRYDVPVSWFCYPSGHYDATVIAAVKAAGYEGSTTVVPGWAYPQDDRYRLRRLRVLAGTTPAGLLELIGGTRDDPPPPPSYG